jgi:hypothetical protein
MSSTLRLLENLETQFLQMDQALTTYRIVAASVEGTLQLYNDAAKSMDEINSILRNTAYLTAASPSRIETDMPALNILLEPRNMTIECNSPDIITEVEADDVYEELNDTSRRPIGFRLNPDK